MIVVSRWSPYRVRDLQEFLLAWGWRRWAESIDGQVLPEGPYARAVFAKCFERKFKGPRVSEDMMSDHASIAIGV